MTLLENFKRLSLGLYALLAVCVLCGFGEPVVQVGGQNWHVLARGLYGNINVSEQDLDVLARTIYGEARGEGRQGMLAVAKVILNRVQDAEQRWGTTIQAVAKQPRQFSCWNKYDPNYRVIRNIKTDDPAFIEAYEVALQAVLTSDDLTRGATHYHTHRVRPGWATRLARVDEVGGHQFYRA